MFRNRPPAKLDKKFLLAASDTAMDIEGFILVGGQSSRMGQDKARLVLNGRSFAERIHDALRKVTARTRTVGAKGAAAPAGLGNVADVYAEWGALGGLHAALSACRAEWALVVACDLPFVTGELFERLAERCNQFDAVVPVQEDGRLQPLCALYRADVCRERARELIERGERRPRALVEAVRTRRIETHELEDLAGASLFFTNVNTPEEWEHARRAHV